MIFTTVRNRLLRKVAPRGSRSFSSYDPNIDWRKETTTWKKFSVLTIPVLALVAAYVYNGEVKHQEHEAHHPYEKRFSIYEF